MKQYEQTFPSTLPRTSSCNSSNKLIIPSNYLNSTNSPYTNSFIHQKNRGEVKVNFNFLKSLLKLFPSILCFQHACLLISLHILHKIHAGKSPELCSVIGGHVSFAIQDHSMSSEPSLLIEFAISTSTLVKDMSSGLVESHWNARKCHVAAGN